MPRLLLITASSPEIRKVRRVRVLNFQQITMPYLATRVPRSWDVTHVDEEAEEIDWSIAADVVGITFHTPSAFHAYDIARRFRSRGVCVVMGGPHVSLLPEEASQYADVIFIGEAEGLWEDFLKSFESGTYLRRYQQAGVPSIEHIPQPRRDLFHRRDHTDGVLFATRGCPGQCDFCTIAVMYRHKLRKRPIAEVAAEYASVKGNVIIFWDDNIAGDLEYSKKLFRAIAPYGKWWSSQVSVHAGRDDEFLEIAARSGCKQLFLGLESISQQSMAEVNKGFNRVEEYAQIIDRIHAHGIAVQAGIVFGFDHDTPEIFEETIDFLERAGVQNATFNILTPFPGTPLFRRMEAEGHGKAAITVIGSVVVDAAAEPGVRLSVAKEGAGRHGVSLSWPSAPSRPSAAACLASGWPPGRCVKRPIRLRPRRPERPPILPTVATREHRWAWPGATA